MSDKIYTGLGDYGETSIFSGGRIKKKSPLVGACGTLDELSSFIGVCRAHCEEDYQLNSLLKEVQQDLYKVAGHVAGSDESIDENRISYIENQIDKYAGDLPGLNSFILPSGTRLAAFLHVSRAVCRRAERIISLLYENEGKFLTELKYLNRLSDLLFILSRYSNKRSGEKEEYAY